MVLRTDIFGASATVDNTDTQNPKMTIHWVDFKDSLGGTVSSLPVSGEDWLAGLLYFALDSLVNIPQTDKKTTIAALATGLTTFNNTRQRAFNLQVSFYEPDDGASRPSSLLL